MKIYLKISFRILFSLAILFCFGVNYSSGIDIQRYIVEFPSDTNSVGNSFIPDIDPVNDDQINHPDKPGSLVESRHQIPVLNDSCMILEFFSSVWQPPKLS
jgi:hypothetical protein